MSICWGSSAELAGAIKCYSPPIHGVVSRGPLLSLRFDPAAIMFRAWAGGWIDRFGWVVLFAFSNNGVRWKKPPWTPGCANGCDRVYERWVCVSRACLPVCGPRCEFGLAVGAPACPHHAAGTSWGLPSFRRPVRRTPQAMVSSFNGSGIFEIRPKRLMPIPAGNSIVEGRVLGPLTSAGDTAPNLLANSRPASLDYLRACLS